MRREDVDAFEKLVAQLQSLQAELGALAKKSPKDAVNTFKLKFINATIQQCNDLLGEKYRPFSEFDVFSPDDLPSNSDVTFIISQYLECAEKYRADNIFMRHAWWWWVIEGEMEDRPSCRTAPPRKIENR